MFVQKTDLVSQARMSKKLPNFIWAIILALIFMFCGEFLGGLISYPLIKYLGKTNFFTENKEMILLLITLLSFMFTSLVVFFRVSKIEKRKIETIGFYKDKWLRKYAIGFLIGLFMMSVVVLVLFMQGYIEVEKRPIQPVGISAIGSVLIILIGWIVQGGTEEVLTRGWLMNILGARYNITFGLILSSVFFGLLHLGNPNISYIAILNIILVGIFFGLCVIKTNNLWIVCGMHSAWNFAQGNLFGFEVSGLNVQVGSLFDLNLVGNDIVTGGIFGPEAGLASTFVLALGILTVFILDKRGYFSKNR